MLTTFANRGASVHNARNSKMGSTDLMDDQDCSTSMQFYKKQSKHPWHKLPYSAFYDPVKEPLQVCLNVVVLNLGDVSTTQLCYRMRIEIWVAWTLTEEEVYNYIDDPFHWEPTMRPDPMPWTISVEKRSKMVFLSGRTIQVFMWRGKIVASECTLVTARYLESMELENFPFDCQHLNFRIGLRCDCDMPLRIVHDKIMYNTIESVDGFLNFDGRAMTPLFLNPKACTFNVRSSSLSLEEFCMSAIECEIENSPRDIPFLHCSMRLYRNFFPYIFRVFLPLFVIMINSTFALRFEPGNLDSRLSYVVTNMLTIVAFFFVISSLLPNIPYLTVVDIYMTVSLAYVFAIAVLCLCLEYKGLEGDGLEAAIFVFCLVGLAALHILLGAVFYFLRLKERKKLKMNRHEIDEDTQSRRDIIHEEFLVHTDIHSKGAFNVYVGTKRSLITPSEAAGWLNEGGGRLLEVGEQPYNIRL